MRVDLDPIQVADLNLNHIRDLDQGLWIEGLETGVIDLPLAGDLDLYLVLSHTGDMPRRARSLRAKILLQSLVTRVLVHSSSISQQ